MRPRTSLFALCSPSLLIPLELTIFLKRTGTGRFARQVSYDWCRQRTLLESSPRCRRFWAVMHQPYVLCKF